MRFFIIDMRKTDSVNPSYCSKNVEACLGQYVIEVLVILLNVLNIIHM